MPNPKAAPPYPLAELFGFPAGNHSAEAQRYRENRWCPFNNPSGANCTKDKVEDPLGVCSIMHKQWVTITCPVRFRQEWRLLEDATAFFFPHYPKDRPRPIMLSEVPLKDKQGKAAGTIDIVLVTLDDHGYVTDYGAIEIQAVYISGNVRGTFTHYMHNQATYEQGWPTANYPHPDYLSSSRKRLVPQLIYKGGILHHWGRKLAVAVQRSFFQTLPRLAVVTQAQAEVAWLVYDLTYDAQQDRYHLAAPELVYTEFRTVLETIATPVPGDEQAFIQQLQSRVVAKKTPPDTKRVMLAVDTPEL